MNDVHPPAEDQANVPPPSPQPAAQKGSSVRLVVLLIILAIALGGLLYDYMVARPALNKARATLEKALDGTTKDPDGDGAFSIDEVHQLLGRDADILESIDGGKKETYLWRSGMPFRQYKLIVGYVGTQVPLLNAISINEELSQGQLPPKHNVPAKEMTEEERENFKPSRPMGAGMGGGGKRGMGGGDGQSPDGKKKSRPRGKNGKKGKGGGGGSMNAVAPPDDEKKTEPAAEKKTEPATEKKAEPNKAAEPKTDATTPEENPPATKPAEKKD